MEVNLLVKNQTNNNKKETINVLAIENPCHPIFTRNNEAKIVLINEDYIIHNPTAIMAEKECSDKVLYSHPLIFISYFPNDNIESFIEYKDFLSQMAYEDKGK